MAEHRTPGLGTVKRLYAVSGNQCAFEKCDLPLVDNDSGKVTGRICHIKARSENGPRFDFEQTEEQNMSFANLILMCSIHHDVIDSDLISYTTARLLELKDAHEIKFKNGHNLLEDDKSAKLIQNIKIDSIKIGSYFSLSNVNHSQVAETIYNNTISTGAKALVLNNKLESLKQLEGIYNYILPDKLHEDMDWDDALLLIAYRFENIKFKIKTCKSDFSAFYGKAIESKLTECMEYCTEGGFEVSKLENDMNSEALTYANKLYDQFLVALNDYKDKIRNSLGTY